MATGMTTASDLSNLIVSVYSKELLLQALPILEFYTFAKEKVDLTKSPGDSIKFIKFANLSLATTALDETVDMPTEKMASSVVSIGVDEYGKAIEFSQKAVSEAMRDVLADASTLLSRNVAWTMDTLMRDALINSGASVVFPNGVSAKASITSADYINEAVIKDAVEVLESADAPKFANDFYVLFVTVGQARRIRDISSLIPPPSSVVTQGTEKGSYITGAYKGELGALSRVRIIATNQMPVESGGATDGTDVHTAVLFGENTLALAMAQWPELKDGGLQDYGRKHGIAWNGVFGAGILDAGNVCLIQTAP